MKYCKTVKQELFWLTILYVVVIMNLIKRGTLGMSLVMQAKPKSAELILVFLILRVNISGKRTSQMVINVLLLEE